MAGAAQPGLPGPVRRHGRRPGRSRPQARLAGLLLDELRAAVGRDAETAAAVRLALEQQYPQQAADLYRMLWGYTDKDLQAGEDAKLVRGLDDDERWPSAA